MSQNEHMTTPAEGQKTEKDKILPAKLGFIKHSDAKSAVNLKENFMNYLTNMNSARGILKKKK